MPSQELAAKWLAAGDQRTADMVSAASAGRVTSFDAMLITRGEERAFTLDKFDFVLGGRN